MAANIAASQAGSMRMIGLLALFITGMPVGLAEAAKVDHWKFCTDTKEVSAEQKIAACSTIIETKGITGQDLARALNRRGLAFLSNRAFDAAARDFEQAIKVWVGFTAAYGNLAEALRYKGELDRAFSAVETFIRLDPKNSRGYNRRGLIWLARGEPARAIPDFDHAIELDPKYPFPYSNRAAAWSNLGNFDRYCADAESSIRADPKHSPGYAERADCLLSKRDLDRALVEADKAIALNGQLANGYNLRGAVFRDKGERERAIKDFTEAIRLQPEFVHPYSNRGMTRRAMGDLDGAIEDLSEAIRLDPAFNFAYAQRGIAFADRGDIERAGADFSAALATPPKYLTGKRAQDIARSRLALLPATAPTDNRANTANAPPPNATGAVKRVALVIGNSRYANAPALPNPANDARAVAVALRNLGFEVAEGIDLDHAAMEHLLQDYLRQSSRARLSLLFYAGHGMQVDGRNYLVPIDAKLTAPTDLNFETIDLDRLLSALDDETHANIVILDACRDNPLTLRFASQFGSGRSAAISNGLAAYSNLGTGTLIAFATAPGHVALDGQGPNSPFTTALLKNIQTPGIEIRQMLTRVRAEVAAATAKKQIPWDNSSLLGEVFLAGAGKR